MTTEDGAWVTFVGPSTAGGPSFGDEGRALAAGPGYAHVQWRTGGRIGQVDMVLAEDYAPGSGLVPERTEADLDALGFREPGMDLSLDGDPVGALESLGALAPLSAAAEEAVQLVHGAVRRSPGMVRLLAGLDPEAGDFAVEQTSRYLLREALGGEADGA